MYWMSQCKKCGKDEIRAISFDIVCMLAAADDTEYFVKEMVAQSPDRGGV